VRINESSPPAGDRRSPDHHSSLTTETLSKQLNVSRETIRRDLSELQAQGKVLRNHGRAKVIHQRSQDSGDLFTCG